MTSSMDINFFLDDDESRAFQGIVGNKILQRDQLLHTVDDLDNSPIYSVLRYRLADVQCNPFVADQQFSSGAQEIGFGSGADLMSGHPSDQETIDFLLKINQNLTFENIELRNRLHYCYFCGNCSGI